MDIPNQEKYYTCGDLNFSFGRADIWGSTTQVDPLSNFFTQRLEEKGVFNIEPIKLNPTWRNKRVGEDRIAKRLDRFLLYEGLVNDHFRFRQRMGLKDDSNHFPFFLDMAKIRKKPPTLSSLT
jgi:hypothetical protein